MFFFVGAIGFAIASVPGEKRCEECRARRVINSGMNSNHHQTRTRVAFSKREILVRSDASLQPRHQKRTYL